MFNESCTFQTIRLGFGNNYFVLTHLIKYRQLPSSSRHCTFSFVGFSPLNSWLAMAAMPYAALVIFCKNCKRHLYKIQKQMCWSSCVFQSSVVVCLRVCECAASPKIPLQNQSFPWIQMRKCVCMHAVGMQCACPCIQIYFIFQFVPGIFLTIHLLLCSTQLERTIQKCCLVVWPIYAPPHNGVAHWQL